MKKSIIISSHNKYDKLIEYICSITVHLLHHLTINIAIYEQYYKYNHYFLDTYSYDSS